MNQKSGALKQLLKKRGMTLEKLARAARVHPLHLSQVLAESRNGRMTWPRIKDVISAEEEELIVGLYGPVFGKVPETQMEEAVPG